MYALASTLVTILRGTTTDEFGDVIDDNSTVAASGIPMQLIETTDNVMDPVTGTPKVVRSMLGRADPRTDIVLTDRIQDQADAAIYAIRDITLPKRAGYSADMELDLQAIN